MSNVHTLGNDDDDKQSRRRSNSNDSENSDEGRQGFFVGGSDRSGQEVLGPTRNDNISARFFEAIQRAGAEQMTPQQDESLNTSAGQNGGGRASGGAMAFQLGGHGVQSTQIGGTSTAESNTRKQAPVVVRLVFWHNGFTVDDGPLRQFQDPSNKEFIQAIMMKRIPSELTMSAPGREFDLRIERKSSDYEPPKAKPFSGKGNQLGSITPNVGTSASDVIFVDAPPKPSAEETAKLVEQAQAELKVDDNLPTTRIQIRIPDSARPIVARLNQTQTVNQLRIFIVSADPTLAYRPFRLMTSYPIQPIEDEDLSVKDAALLNATVLVKFE